MTGILRFLFISILSVLFISCKNETKEVALGSTNSKLNAISLVISDDLWAGRIGDSIRNKFATPVLGLPEEEPLFTINQYADNSENNFMSQSRNIIMVSLGTFNQFEIRTDAFAKPQNVFYITGKDINQIINILEKNHSQITSIIHDTEIEECQRIIKESEIDNELIKEKFNILLDIPSEFKYALNSSGFSWFKKDIMSGSTSLLVYQVPISSIKNKNNLVSNIIRVRDSISCLYVHGKESNTEMITEESYSPYFFKNKLSGKELYEMKGTWELKNDFMSGPFLNYAIVDQPNNRILVLEGFCYSPLKDKRDLMHELESIIKSVVILNQND
jgi:hypothetical protein